MRMLLTVHLPHEPFNQYVRSGEAGALLNEILAALQPQHAFFSEMHGQRTALLVVEVAEAADIPRFAEPWFLKFEADCEFRILMDGADLARAGLEGLGERWG